MQLPDTHDDYLKQLSERIRQAAEQLLEGLPADGEIVRLESTSDLLAHQPASRLFRIHSGQLRYLHLQKVVYLLEPGDLLGFDRSLQLLEGTLQSDTAVELIPYQRDALMAHANRSASQMQKWTHYLLCLNAFYRESLARALPRQLKLNTGFLSFETGEVIISQGDEADCVYTMLEGSAEALRDGIKVGDIKAEETFGAMAVFTGRPRSATVRATSDCCVLAVRKNEFMDLVAEQPQVAINLVEEMAAKINQLNHKLLDLQSVQ